MKIKHLLLTALIALVGGGSSWADDIQDLKATGWTQVTELTDVENNYYVFVDAGTGLYSIGRGLAAGDRPMSHVLGNPTADDSQVWILEGSGSTFKMKNLKDNYYFNSGSAGWNDSMDASNGTDFTFAVSEGKYSISASTGHVGPWNNNNKVELTDGAENIAVNKSANQAPGYYVFAMSRTAYDAAKFGATQLETQGWTKATDIASAVGDNYVIFLEAKGGSLVISRNESGRPAYKSLGDPLKNKHELWTIEGEADNYALKSEASNQYLNAQGWNTGFGGLGDDSRRKFVSVSEGKYAIQNKSNNDWLGRWQNQESAPFEMENIAANKNEAQRGNYFVYYMSKSDYATKRAAAITAAAATTPADLTDFIYNPRFSDLDRWGWTEGGSSGNRQFASNAAECWNNNNMTFTQKFEGLPNGKYTISVQAVIPDNGGSKGAKLVGNTIEKAIETSHSSNAYATVAAALMNDASLGLNEIDVLVTNGTLELGIKAPTGWVIFDNFKLTYKGEDLSDYEAAYAAANTAAKEVDLDAPMYGVYKTALETAISTYADKTYSTVAEIQEAITALETTTNNATKSIAQYSSNATALVNQKALIDGTNVYAAEGYNAYVTAYEAAKAAYDDRSANEDVVNPNAATGWHASTAYNFLLTPWTFAGEACSEFTKDLHINTWSTEGDTDGSNFQVPFFEYWVADGENLQNKELATSVADIENGLYSVTALVRVRAKNGVAAADASGITLAVNEGEAVDATNGAQVGSSQFSLAEVTAEGLVKDGKLNIKFIIDNTNISWLSYKNVKYTKVRDLTPEEQIVYATAEDIEALNAAIEAAEAKTIGFLEGQYSPYTNKEAIKAIADAKALDVVNPIDVELVNAAKDALDNATWTVNAEEMNAVDNGDFEGSYSVLAGSGVASDRAIYVPEGWTVNYTNRETNDMTCLNSSTLQWSQFKDLPQPSNGGANTYWERTRWSTSASIVLSQDVTLPAGNYTLSADAYINGNTANAKISVAGQEAVVNQTSWNNYKVSFTLAEPQTVTVAFSFVQGGSAADSRVGFDNFVLKLATVERTTATEKYGTICLPYAFTATGATVYSATINDPIIELEEVETPVAGVPYIYKATADAQTFAYASGNIVAAPVEAEPLVGVFAATTAPVGSYVLQTQNEKQGFYQVESEITVPANKCYLTVAAGGKAYFFDGEATANDVVKAITTNAIVEFYSENGAIQSSLKKGVNIVKMADGKVAKVHVK